MSRPLSRTLSRILSRSWVFAILASASTALLAQPPEGPAECLRTFRMVSPSYESSPRSYLQALEQAGKARTAGIHPANIIDESPFDSGVLVALANVQRAFGAFYTSDVFFVNPHSSGTAVVDIFFLPNGQDNVATAPIARRFQLGAQSGLTYFDILQSVFGVAGTTGAVFYSVDQTASTGASSTISAWAYTSTPAPTGGRFGSSVQGVGKPWSDSLFDGYCLGARGDSVARTNIGFYNKGTDPLTVRVEIYTSTGQSTTQTVTVPRAGFVQVSLSTPFQYSNALVIFRSQTTNAGWFSYIAVADNITNDFNFQYSSGYL